jgi:hypothetical protein
MTTPIEPNLQDYDAVEREYGKLSENALDAEYLQCFHRAQTHKLVRTLVGDSWIAPDPKATPRVDDVSQ